MYHWFSSYTGPDWTPNKGYNQTFKTILTQIRYLFPTTLQKPGVELGSSRGRFFWIPVRDADGHPYGKYQLVCVQLLILKYQDYLRLNGYITPLVSLETKFTLIRHGQPEPHFSPTLLLQFPSNYPSSPPLFKVKERQFAAASHQHHMLQNGWICLLADPNQWNSAQDFTEALVEAISHTAWHFDTFRE